MAEHGKHVDVIVEDSIGNDETGVPKFFGMSPMILVTIWSVILCSWDFQMRQLA